MLPNKIWVINNHYSKPVLISRVETCIMINKILVCISSDLHKAGHWPEYIGLYSFFPALGWLGRELNTVSARHKSPLNPRQTLRPQNSRLQNTYNNTTTCSQVAEVISYCIQQHVHIYQECLCLNWITERLCVLLVKYKGLGGAFLATPENDLKLYNENETKLQSH
jgi:hypothetical protein